ncbi:MAG: phosphotransferase family protein [Candidatus Heimdallarchaeota archaeon]
MPLTNLSLRKLLESYLMDLFPSHRDLQIIELQKITLGWETEKYSLTMSYDGATGRNQQDLFIRVFVDQNAAEHATREHRVMTKLHELGFPVPKIFCLELDKSPLAGPFMMMEKISGRSLMSFLLEASEEETSTLLSQFCEIWVNLHQLDWNSFAADPSKIILEDPLWYINQSLSEREGHLKRHQEAQMLLPILEWLKARSSEVLCQQLSLIHGDYHPNNVLMRDNGALFVIDWGAAKLDDFRADLGWTVLLTTTYGYSVRESLLNEYERLSGIQIEQIEYFEVLAILRRLSDLVVSLAPTSGAGTLGMRPEAIQMMKQDAFHYKNVYSLLQKRTGLDLPEIEAILASL